MNEINRTSFFTDYREAFGHLTQGQVNGLETLISLLERDERVTDPRHAAYMLATAKHETGNDFQPVPEDGRGKGKPYGKPDRVTGQVYYGRGYVQLTWADNYKAQGHALGIDLYHYPEEALKPGVAYDIMSRGMRLGMFTGVGLSHYIYGESCDYHAARKIINGLDCADRIAGYAAHFETILKGALSC